MSEQFGITYRKSRNALIVTKSEIPVSAAIAVQSDAWPVSVSTRKITFPPKAAVTF